MRLLTAGIYSTKAIARMSAALPRLSCDIEGDWPPSKMPKNMAEALLRAFAAVCAEQGVSGLVGQKRPEYAALAAKKP